MGTTSTCTRIKYSLALILVITFWHQTTAGTCKEGCPVAAQNSKYKFTPGQEYTYDLDSSVTIYVSGSKQQTTVKVTGQVQLYAVGNCQYYLYLPKLTITSPGDVKVQTPRDLQKPVKFILSNDELVPEICADGDDSQFSLNIKRAIISLIQSTDGKNYETDVFGVCQTSTVTSTGGDGLFITKSRDLTACAHREILSDGFIKGIINEASGIKATPILNGEYRMEQKIKDGILSSVTLNEQYTYLPFSTLNTGARAKVETKLIFVKSGAASAPKTGTTKERTLLFENFKNVGTTSPDQARNALKKAVETFNVEAKTIGKNTASKFAELVRALRKSKKDDLIRLYAAVKNGDLKLDKELARKVYLDALFRAGSANAVAAISDLMKKEFSETEQRLAYLSFNLAQTVTKDSLVAAAKTLGPQSTREAFMGVGTLVKRFCGTKTCTAADVKDIYTKYANNIGSCKPQNRLQEDKIVAVLKAVRNAGVLFEPVTARIQNCLAEGINSRLRVAAVQALGASSCAKNIQGKILDLLKNRVLDSEIRIEAYLALTKCPTPSLANEIKALLDDEPVYQVGSFITSHLSNIHASADPHRESLRRVLGNIKPSQRFPSDIRKYSFNRELSYAIDSLGVGASIDSNVIYSQKGFLPRSGSLNVTGELFGNIFNVFEVNMRQENLELVMERYFGPKGEFSMSNLPELVKDFMASYTKIMEGTSKRFPRGIARTDVDQATTGITYQKELFSDVEMDLSIKLFGTEMYFLSLGDGIPSNSQEFIKEYFQAMDAGIKNAKKFNKVYENHVLFMDTELVYPTSVGLPLKLGVQGVGSGRIEIGGATDVKKLFKTPEWNYRIVPSYNIDITGSFLIDALNMQSGLKLQATLHSATGAQVDFKMTENQKSFESKLSFPFRDQDIVTFKTNAAFIVVDSEKINVEFPVTAEGSKKKTGPAASPGCFDQFFAIIGVTPCVEIDTNLGSGPDSLAFPFAGLNTISLKLEVEKEFTLTGAYDDSNPKRRKVTYVFDTPGQGTRRTELQLESAFDTDYFVRVAVDSPLKKASVEAGLKNNDKEFGLYAQAKLDSDVYLAKFGFDVAGDKNRAEYTPLIVIKGPKDGTDSLGGYKATGKIIVDRATVPTTKYIFNDVKMITPTNENSIVKGYVTVNPGQIDYDMTYTEEKTNKNAKVKGVLEYKEGKKFVFDLTSQNDFADVFNGKLRYESVCSGEKPVIDNKMAFELIYGKDVAASKNKLVLSGHVKRDPDAKLYLSSANVEIPIVPVAFKYDVEFKPNFHKLNVDLQATTNKIGVTSNGKYNAKTTGDYDVEVQGVLNAHNAKVTAVRVVGDKTSDHKINLVSSCGLEFGLDGKLSNTMLPNNVLIDLNAKLIVPQKKTTPYAMKFYLQSTKDKFESNANVQEGSTTIATYKANGVRSGADVKEVNFDVDVTDILVGNSQFKSTKGKGTFTTLVTLKKIDRKLKIESDFNVAQPIYDVNTKFFYDFEKDNNKKIEFTTKSKFDASTIDSKNTLVIISEKYTLNLVGSQSGTRYNGKTNGVVEFGLPTGRIVSANVDRTADYVDGKGTEKLKFQVFDQLPNGNKRSVFVESSGKMTDVAKKLFDANVKVTYTGFDKKEAIITNTIQRTANGDAVKTNIGLNVDGTVFTNPITLNLLSDEFSDTKAEQKLTGKYGTQMDFEVFNKYDINTESGKPTISDIKATINIPDTQLKTIKFNLYTSNVEPEQEDGLYECVYRGGLQFGEKSLGLDSSMKVNLKQADWKLQLIVPNYQPVNLKLKYNQDDKTPDTVKQQFDLEILYDQNKKIHFTTDALMTGTEYNLKANLQSPLENAKDVKLNVNAKVSGGNKYSSDIKLYIDQKDYQYRTVFVKSEISPSMDIEFESAGVVRKFFFAVQKLEDAKYATQLNVDKMFGFQLDFDAEVFFKSPDAFYLKSNFNPYSEKIKPIYVEVSSKTGGRGIDFKGTSGGEPMFSGTAEFQVKDDKGKMIIEGNGNIKLKDNADVGTTFKFIKNQFSAAKDGESGVSYVFDGRFGTKNIISELKLTDKNIALKHTACEAKKQCVNIDLRSTLQKTELNDFKHELLISIDLRELGATHEFGLRADTAQTGYVIDHTVEMHLQSQDKNKYQYSFYIHKNSAGVVLTLPVRTIALESTFNYPTDQVFGKYDAAIAFYPNKVSSANDKTSLTFIGSVDRIGNNAGKSKGELRLEHPKIKPLVISGIANFDADNDVASAKVTFDIFQQEQKKIIVQASYEDTDKSLNGFNITTDLKINSKGLGIDITALEHLALNYDTRVFSLGSNIAMPTKDFVFAHYLFASDKNLEMFSRVFNEEVLKMSANYDVVKKSATYNSVFKELGTTPIVINGQVDGLTTASLTLTKGDLVDVKGQFDLGKEASVYVKGDGKQLFTATLSLADANFMTTNFKIQEDDVKSFLTKLQEVSKAEGDSMRKAYTEKFVSMKNALLKVWEGIQGSLPDFTALKSDYNSQWQKFQAELEADPTAKIFTVVAANVMTVADKVLEIMKSVFVFYEKIAAAVKEVSKDLEAAFNEKILPILKDLFTQIETLVRTLYDETISLYSGVFERVAKALKGFEEDFNKISAAVSGLFKNVAVSVKEYFDQLQKEFEEIFKLLLAELQAMQGFEEFKAKINEFLKQNALGEHIAGILKELLELVKDNMPTEETKVFIKDLSDYIYAKLMRQEVNDTESIKKILQSAAAAIRSLTNLLQDIRKEKDVSGWMGVPIFDSLKRVSTVWNVKFSPLKCLQDGNCFNVRDILSYRPYGFDFTELFPPFKLHAHLGDGQHIFTFDGRHMTFPGSCSYVLAHDALDKNFTLVANLVNGKLDSIALMDKENSVEVTKEGVVQINGAPTELPLNKDNIHVWRRYYTISLLTQYGVNVLCSTDLRICHVTVSGFYHSRLRGLLGNGNYEPYDDLLTPAGTIAPNEAVLGNAYKASSSCADVAPVKHTHQSDELCSQFFGGSSTLRMCYLLVPYSTYKEACLHAVETATDKKDAACNIALLYASSCKLENIPVTVPPTCAKCTRTEKPVEVADDFTIETPKQQADVVLLVDTDVKNVGTLVEGLVNNVRAELKNKKFTDVRVSIIGFSKYDKYPSLFTTNGDLDFSGKFPNVELNGPKYKNPFDDEKLNTWFEAFMKSVMIIGLSSNSRATKLLVDYPYRPSAVKIVLAVRSEGYHNNNVHIPIMASARGLARVEGVFVHTLLPLEELTIGGAQDSKAIVGFSDTNVLQLTDGRKQPQGSAEFRSKLDYGTDVGVALALKENDFIFALQNYEALEPNKQKQFIQTMSAAIASQAATTQRKLICTCVLRHGLHAEEVCIVKDETVTGRQGRARAYLPRGV